MCSVMSDFLQPSGLQPAGSSLHGIFSSKNTGVGCHFLLQGIFPTQGLNLCLLCLLQWQADSLPLCHLGSPKQIIVDSTLMERILLNVFFKVSFWEGVKFKWGEIRVRIRKPTLLCYLLLRDLGKMTSLQTLVNVCLHILHRNGIKEWECM